ncbi:tryptophan-rich sensory protein [Microbacterium oryzae]|uniref:tryptophan-rich sensory protein n=1 Tax=Microbacterium oryzae TaxID=743009 RepID=UPI0025B08B1F|nr:tryptophan-rich sensory protein [Microbacterium oryzae]MDN3310385.1 tryptophan-rich sensory protein [Microbacterium oryzae]
MDTTRQTGGRDILRQVAVISATCFMLVAAMVGVGLFGGTAVQDLQGGALDADASYLAPARPAFSIWTPIYVGLVLYAIWQALPGQRARSRQRAIGWWIAASEVLNGCWLLAAQFLNLPATVAVIFALAAVLAVTFRAAVRAPGDGVASAVLIDGVTGLHLGWVTLATVANTAAWLTQTAPADWADAAAVFGIAVLAVVALIGVALGWRGRGRLAPALALAWGLSWLAVGRLSEEPASAAIGGTAVAVAVVVLVAAVVFRLTRGARRA